MSDVTANGGDATIATKILIDHGSVDNGDGTSTALRSVIGRRARRALVAGASFVAVAGVSTWDWLRRFLRAVLGGLIVGSAWSARMVISAYSILVSMICFSLLMTSLVLQGTVGFVMACYCGLDSKYAALFHTATLRTNS